MQRAVHIGSGGNRVFFSSGVLYELRQNRIDFDHLIGGSSGSAMVFAHKFDVHKEMLEFFADKLDKNRSNLGLREFPHHKIYEDSVRHLFGYAHQDTGQQYTLVASTAPTGSFGALFATAAMAADAARMKVLPRVREKLGIRPYLITSYDHRSAEETIKFILGSSMFYPFIKKNRIDNELIMEAKLAGIAPDTFLEPFSKGVSINTKPGQQGVKNGIYHISPEKKLSNIINYTNPDPLYDYFDHGREIAYKHKDSLREYLALDSPGEGF